jgi:hypothetical protein
VNPQLHQAIEQAVWYPYNVLPQEPDESTHSWIVRAVVAVIEPTLAEYEQRLGAETEDGHYHHCSGCGSRGPIRYEGSVYICADCNESGVKVVPNAQA